jgi:hypothetical protein
VAIASKSAIGGLRRKKKSERRRDWVCSGNGSAKASGSGSLDKDVTVTPVGEEFDFESFLTSSDDENELVGEVLCSLSMAAIGIRT